MVRGTYLERVCLHRCPEVLGVYADHQLVDLEVVWAADDGTVGVFLACEVSWAQVSIRKGQKGSQGTYFARPSFQASIGVAMLAVGGCLLVVGRWVLVTESWMSGVPCSVLDGQPLVVWCVGSCGLAFLFVSLSTSFQRAAILRHQPTRIRTSVTVIKYFSAVL
jgi:hypothetical protein